MPKIKQKKKKSPNVKVSFVNGVPITLPPVLPDTVDQLIQPSQIHLTRTQAQKTDPPHEPHEKKSEPTESEEDSPLFPFFPDDKFASRRESFLTPKSGSTDMVKLNVGGNIFCTSIGTLSSRGGMLAAMFSGRYSPFRDQNDCYFIDRDGTHFRYVLNYLRDGYVALPDDLQSLQELMIESQYYQLSGLIKVISEAPQLSKNEYITIRYLPANTYDGWPIRIEGPLESHIICQLNGGSLPPPFENNDVKNMYGQPSTGWKVRGIFLTKIFNIIASYGWSLTTSNGSGGGKQRNFAEMYVFSRSKLFRRKRSRRSTTINYSHLFPNLNSSEDEGDDEEDLLIHPHNEHVKTSHSSHKSETTSSQVYHSHHEDSFREPVAILLPQNQSDILNS